MKNLTVYLLLCVVLCSCKKDEKQTQTQKMYDVKFAVTGFEHEIVDFETGFRKQNRISDSKFKDQINQLAFIVYDKSGNEVAREIQTTILGKFGFYAVSLPIGDYTAVVVGSKASFGINKWFEPHKGPLIRSNLSSAFMAYEQPGEYEDDVKYRTDDTFFKKVDFRVGDLASGEVSGIVLERIVGKLEFQIEDVPNFTVEILDDATGFKFSTGETVLPTDADLGGIYFPVDALNPRSFYLLKTDAPTLIALRSGDRKFEISVPIHKNKRTIVKGKMLSHSYQAPFTISVDDKWSTDSVVVNL